MLAIIPAMDAAIAIVNRAVTSVVDPATIPALELHEGVPASLRSIVVMPTLLASRAEIDEQIERLEVHYLASPDGELYFALLSDWIDSTTETAPGDDVLLAEAAGGIAPLINVMDQGRRARDFCCSIAAASGTKPKACGWAASASAASCTN